MKLLRLGNNFYIVYIVIRNREFISNVIFFGYEKDMYKIDFYKFVRNLKAQV